MKKCLPTLLALFITFTSFSQVISNFTWESNPPTQAVTGPNAISISSSATVSAGGATGNGLNPGNPKMDIDLVLPGSPYFDVPGIDISISFRKEESQASFFKRGSMFDFGVEGNNLNAKFRVSDGAGGNILVNAANVYSIPSDHKFHTYRFIYNSNTGKAVMSVDGTEVYSYTGTANRALAWNNSGNVVIGTAMDATGANVPVLDNLLVQNVPINAVLPIKLISFTVQPQANTAALNWSASKEEHFSRFIVERSADGISYAPVATVAAAGSVTAVTSYSYTDKTPFAPVSYYRLKMVDANGSFSYSEIRTASFGTTATFSAFPNPAKDVINVRVSNTNGAQYRYSIVALNGKVQDSKVLSSTRGLFTLNLPASMQPGVYMMEVENLGTQTKQSFKIVKL